jgi:hypothetical protein
MAKGSVGAAGSAVPPEQDRRFIEARVGAVERSWGPRAVIAQDGPAVGRRQIDLRHLGGLEVTVEVDNFLDLGSASFNGRPVSFVAPTTSDRADSWARRWQGGLLTTCGLTAVGQAEPAEGGTHGRAHLVPATVTRSGGQWSDDGAYSLAVEGIMREGAIFEQNLTVHRSITAKIGRSVVRVFDVIRNEGFGGEPVRILYHINLGWPLLHGGATVTAEARAPHATDASAPASWTRELVDPEALAPEHVDALIPQADGEGWSAATLRGDDGTVTVKFRPEQLPYLTIWRSPAAGSYALGIEPGTCWPSHAEGPDHGKAGRMLAPGESFDVEIIIEFCS